MTIFNLATRAAMTLPGAQTCVIVDLETGTCLGRSSNATFDLGSACIVNAQMLRNEIRLIQEQTPGEVIEDWMMTLGQHYHLIRVLDNRGSYPLLFLYLITDRTTTNLAMARRKLADIEQSISHIPEIEKYIADASPSPVRRSPVNFATASAFDDEDTDEELPPFMRDDVVLKLLGIAPDVK